MYNDRAPNQQLAHLVCRVLIGGGTDDGHAARGRFLSTVLDARRKVRIAKNRNEREPPLAGSHMKRVGMGHARWGYLLVLAWDRHDFPAGPRKLQAEGAENRDVPYPGVEFGRFLVPAAADRLILSLERRQPGVAAAASPNKDRNAVAERTRRGGNHSGSEETPRPRDPKWIGRG
jgi:hypothetical protein